MQRIVCEEAVTLLGDMGEGGVPLIVTDPPYGIGYHSNHYKGKNPHAPIAHDWNFQIGDFLRAAERVLVDGGAMYLFSRWDVYPLWYPHIEVSGLKLKTVIVWKKNNWSAGDLQGCFGNQYEQILFLVKGRHLLRGYRWPNVWEFDRIPAGDLLHPAQKPVALLQRAIESSSDEGDTVLDPFAGSGSTGVAARQAGRGFLCADVDPRMVRLMRERILGVQSSTANEEPRTPDADFAYPDPAEWGVHPEDLSHIKEYLAHNAAQLRDKGDG